MTSIYRLYARVREKAMSEECLCENRCREIQKGYRGLSDVAENL